MLKHWCSDLEPVVVRRHQADLLVPGASWTLTLGMRPSVVLHLAWTASGTAGYRSSPDNERWVETSLELREAARAVGARYIATGTGVDDTAPVDAYAAAKQRLRQALGEDIGQHAIAWLRPFYVTDPEGGRPELVAHALHMKSKNRTAALRTPYALHDFVHVADAARAIALVVSRGVQGAVDIGAGRLRPVHELVTALGVPWRADDTTPAPTAQVHTPADTAVLRAAGWWPTMTEELFQDG